MQKCSLVGCDRNIYARQLCKAHHHRLLRHGYAFDKSPIAKIGAPKKKTYNDRVKWFLEHTTKTDGCWHWTGGITKSGYGEMGKIGTKRIWAHHFSYETVNGSIPDGLLVLHHCDNPKCVNPDHLFLGTVKDNVQDALSKCRMNQGEKCYMHKLSEKEVIVIKRVAKSWGTSWFKPISKILNVTPECLFNIHRGKTWRHISKTT